jgi:hypothetical protein
MRSLVAGVITCLAFASAPASAQWPPDHLKNVQVLPKDIAFRALVIAAMLLSAAMVTVFG